MQETERREPPDGEDEAIEARFRPAPPLAPETPADIAEPALHVPEPPIPAPAAPRVRCVFTRDELARSLAFLDQAEHGGLVTHLFALRTLLPSAIPGLNGETAARLAAEREALGGVVNRLFIKLRLPRAAITGKDLEDRASRSALVDLVRALRDAQPAPPAPPPLGAVVLEGTVDVDALVVQLEALESEPIGAARPWLVLAGLLPDGVANPPVASALAIYRDGLLSTFGTVAALPNEEFHRVLTGAPHPALDEALREVRATLRGVLEADVARA